MSKPPSQFLQFLKDKAKMNGDELQLTVSITEKALARLIDEARQYEDFYHSPPDSKATTHESKTKRSTEANVPPANDVTPWVTIHNEAKQALSNLKDRRTALQVIAAIAEKNGGAT